jgi:hypothetical protein
VLDLLGCLICRWYLGTACYVCWNGGVNGSVSVAATKASETASLGLSVSGLVLGTGMFLIVQPIAAQFE